MSSLRSRTTAKRKAVTPRQWRVVLIRSRGEFLGYVEAADVQAAEAAAIRAFQLNEHQRKRLIVRERG
jgi:hypothetical protein